MAVQAQYPSNILLLNRSGQEGHDYSLQRQPGGFIDQSHMLLNTGGTNPRKRGRELSALSFYPFPLQQTQPPPQLIDLSQLHNHQPNVVSTGLRLSFGDQQHHHHNQRQRPQQQNNLLRQSSSVLSLLPEDFALQIKQYRDEIDQLLHAQGEEMRRTLAEKRQKHYRALLGAAEESVARRLREKEEEVEKVTRRNAELEARAAQLTVEAQVWQAKARAQEAAAASLQAQLQQAMMSGGLAAQEKIAGGGGGDGAELEAQAEDAESAFIDPDRVMQAAEGPGCKMCRKRAASVVLLPCRHLCVCTECDRLVQACPLCLCQRNSSVEVFLS